jgi:hypothetical protein
LYRTTEQDTELPNGRAVFVRRKEVGGTKENDDNEKDEARGCVT